MKEPKYNNEAILIHCMKREPHSLIYDHEFINYRDFEVIELCEDLEKNYEYLSSLCKANKEMQQVILMANSFVWAGLFFHHNDIVPEKYKQFKN